MALNASTEYHLIAFHYVDTWSTSYESNEIIINQKLHFRNQTRVTHSVNLPSCSGIYSRWLLCAFIFQKMLLITHPMVFVLRFEGKTETTFRSFSLRSRLSPSAWLIRTIYVFFLFFCSYRVNNSSKSKTFTDKTNFQERTKTIRNIPSTSTQAAAACGTQCRLCFMACIRFVQRKTFPYNSSTAHKLKIANNEQKKKKTWRTMFALALPPLLLLHSQIKL